MRSADFSDDFERADENPLAGAWVGGYSGEINLQLVSGDVRATAVGGSSNSMMSVTTLTTLGDSWIEATIGTLAGTQLAVLRLHLRMTAPATKTYYCAEVRLNNSAGVTRVQMVDNVAGASTGMGSTDAFTFAAADRVRFEVEAGRQRILKNDVELLTAAATNASIPSTGRLGLSLYMNTSGSLADLEVAGIRGGAIVQMIGASRSRPFPFRPGSSRTQR